MGNDRSEALSYAFPGERIRICNFHFSKCIQNDHFLNSMWFIFFPEHFQGWEPKFRDPRHRFPYNGPIIYKLFDKKISDPFNSRIYKIFHVFDLHARFPNSGSNELVERRLFYAERPTHGVLTNAQ